MSIVDNLPLESLFKRYETDIVLFAREILGVEPRPKQAFFFSEVANNRATEFVWRNGEGSTTALAILAVWRFLVFPDSDVKFFADNYDQLPSVVITTLLSNASKSNSQISILLSRSLKQKKVSLCHGFDNHYLSLNANENPHWSLIIQPMPTSWMSLVGQVFQPYFLIDKGVRVDRKHLDIMMGSLTCPESRLAISLRGIH